MSENSLAKTRILNFIRALGISAWVVVGLWVLASLVLILLIFTLPSAVGTYLTERTIGQLLANAILYLVTITIVVGIPYWFVRYVLRRPQEEGHMRRLLGIDQPFKWRNLGIIFLCIAGYLVGTILLSSLAAFLPWYDASQEQNVGFKNLTTGVDLVIAFVALVVLPPIAEELLFRGYLFGKLRERSGFWFSAIITSVVFGIVHGQWNVGIDTFVLSIFLCILREKTGSVWASMALHGIKNGVAYFFLFIAPLLGLNLLQ